MKFWNGLIDDWRRHLLHAWSVRWMLLTTAMGGLPILVDGLDEYIAPKTFIKLMLFANVCAFGSRFMRQPEKSDA
jgi:hypothetical protein